MKTVTMTQQDMLDLMGSETTEAEADLMFQLLDENEVTETDDVTDHDWSALIARIAQLSDAPGTVCACGWLSTHHTVCEFCGKVMYSQASDEGRGIMQRGQA